MLESSYQTTTTVDLVLFSADAVLGLLEEGREQGYLEAERLAVALLDLDLTAEQIEEIESFLAEHGVEILELSLIHI